MAGDYLAPGHIAHAAWDGQRAARELEIAPDDEVPFEVEYGYLEPR
jgi:hypothetical protein